MYIPIKARDYLSDNPDIYKDYGTIENFIKFSKTLIKHIENRQVTTINGMQLIFCNQYVKELDIDLIEFLDLLVRCKILEPFKRNKLNLYLV